MKVSVAVAIGLAAASTTLTNVAYLREHEAAAAMPTLSMRRPLSSLRLLLGDRSWLLGFAMETGGFALYAAALALAPLALVQSIAAGGIGVLAFVSARVSGQRLSRRVLVGVIVSVLGLLALAISLTGGLEHEGSGDIVEIALWIGASGAAALLVLWLAPRLAGVAVAYGVAGGILFSIGDVSTKVFTQGGVRFSFAVTIVIGYTLGTSLLQLGYQRGGALTVAGLATLLTNALPIAAGTIVLDEPVPSGALGALRILAFVAVIAGAVLLARPEKGAAAREAAEGRTASEPLAP